MVSSKKGWTCLVWRELGSLGGAGGDVNEEFGSGGGGGGQCLHILAILSRSTTPLFLLPLDEECLAAQGYQGGLRANCITQAMNAKKLRKK